MKCRHVWTWTRSWPASHSPMTCSSGAGGKSFHVVQLTRTRNVWGIFSITWCLGGGKGKSLLTSRQLWINLVYNDFLLTWLVDGQMLRGTISALNKVNQGEYQTSAWNSVRMFGQSRRCSQSTHFIGIISHTTNKPPTDRLVLLKSHHPSIRWL